MTDIKSLPIKVQEALNKMPEKLRKKALTPWPVILWDKLKKNKDLKIRDRVLYKDKCYQVKTEYNIGSDKEFIRSNFDCIMLEKKRVQEIKNN